MTTFRDCTAEDAEVKRFAPTRFGGGAISAFARLVLAALLAAGVCIGAEAPREFQVRGRVVEVRAAKREVVVRHEEIPGYMAAMTMPFAVREAKLLDGVKPGDAIAFRLSVTEREAWIDGLKVAPAAPAPASAGPKLDALRPGDALPELAFIDERGRALRLGDYRGQALALTFIFTRCPLPAFCPLLSQKFRAVQGALAADAGAPKNWQLLSVTIDPAHDTPEVLRAYAGAQQADPARWRFATGELREITILALRCGVNFWDESGAIVHNVRTVVVDAQGRVQRVLVDNEWSAEELAGELRKAAGKR